MHTKYHIEITRTALEEYFSEKALQTIITANIRQDRIANALGHDHLHFDGSTFDKGFRYIADQKDQIVEHIKSNDFEQARKAFGRLLHSWQDFYSHSNYVQLWLLDHPNSPAESISYNDPVIINHSDLISGKNYGVVEFIALLPVFSKLVMPLMPADSHAKMNLDQPSSSYLFAYAYWAAYHRTLGEYQHVILQIDELALSQNMSIHFKNL